MDAALSADTSPGGTAFPNGVLSPERPTIGKTGTTDVAQSAFFIGAIPQYSLAVGMFTNSQNGKPGGQTLNILPSVNGQGGGFGGAWPTTIWHTFMQNQFGSLPIEQFATPDYVGFNKWVQVPPQPKPKPNPMRVPSGSAAPVRAAVPARRHRSRFRSRRRRTRSGRRRRNVSPTSPFGGLTVNAVPLAEDPTATAAGP